MSMTIINYQKAFKPINLKGEIKQSSDDFIVEEIISFEPTGEGEHLFLWVQKRDQNTTWVAKQIAKWAGVNNRKVNFGGLKDRYAVTRQWFSIHLPGKADPDTLNFNVEGCKILKALRHNKALKSSALRGNRFNIAITKLALSGQTLEKEVSRQSVIDRIEQIKSTGVPNYFGEQRFGIDGGNLDVATRLFNGVSDDDPISQRMAVSAARSHLFNLVLEQRIQNQTWQQYISGDVCMLNGSKSFFTPNEEDLVDVPTRMQAFDIHPTGLMYGKGASLVSNDVAQIEQLVIESHPLYTKGLTERKLPMERRALRVKLNDFTYQVTPEAIHLSFMLPAGSFATSVVREIIDD